MESRRKQLWSAIAVTRWRKQGQRIGDLQCASSRMQQQRGLGICLGQKSGRYAGVSAKDVVELFCLLACWTEQHRCGSSCTGVKR